MTTTNIEQQQVSYAQTNQNLSKSVLNFLFHQPRIPLANSGVVWYTAQASGKLCWLDPNRGSTHEIALGQALILIDAKHSSNM
jgi:hypothetical protein